MESPKPHETVTNLETNIRPTGSSNIEDSDAVNIPIQQQSAPQHTDVPTLQIESEGEVAFPDEGREGHEKDNVHISSNQTRDAIHDDELKLDLSEGIDSEHFSKLMELDSKGDVEDDIPFSAHEILQESIARNNHEVKSPHGDLIVNFPKVEDIGEPVDLPDSLSPVDDAPDPIHGDTDITGDGGDVTVPQSYQNTPQLSSIKEESGSPEHQGVSRLHSDIEQLDEGHIPETDQAMHTDIPPLSPLVDAKTDGHAGQTTDFVDNPSTIRTQRKGSLIPGTFHPKDTSGNLKLESDPNNPNQAPRAGEINKMARIGSSPEIPEEQGSIIAYARLDFPNFNFYVQTLHAVIGRKSENDTTHKVDVNLGPLKSISRRHAQIFYNFGNGRFELSIIGKNGAFVNEVYVGRGNTVPLEHKTKIQIGGIPFLFVLPEKDKHGEEINAPLDEGATTPLIKDNKIQDVKPPAKVNMKQEVKVKKTKKSDAEKEQSSKKKAGKGATKKIKEKKPPKPPKKVYTLDEIPMEYRTKPTVSYSAMLTTCIRKYSNEKGMSLSEIYGGIRELFPYYKYCPDGWQSSVRHNLSLNKSFRKVSKEGKGWLWGLDEAYIAERERQRQKQAEVAAAKAQAAQLKLEQQNQLKSKKITENAPSKKAMKLNSGDRKQSISQTLAANRSGTKANPANQHKRTMDYLQQQLVILTKDRKGLPKQTIATILTQALRMTINQVTLAAKGKGIVGNPLVALIEKSPRDLNMILAAAVNAATANTTGGKVKQLVSPALLKQMLSPPPAPAAVHPKPSIHSVITETPKEHRSTGKMVGNSSFDPTSLSKFFQPKSQLGSSQPPSSGGGTTNSTNATGNEAANSEDASGATRPDPSVLSLSKSTSPSASVIPQKRPQESESESESSSGSGTSTSGTDSSDDDDDDDEDGEEDNDDDDDDDDDGSDDSGNSDSSDNTSSDDNDDDDDDSAAKEESGTSSDEAGKDGAATPVETRPATNE
ncbi:Fhl1p KNAG_0A07530 [Huiozyma naganishii CBS 8797]|uniref:Pre-rRNA-processing protein FHL1 n=1 Tax=Huiozyma naganishii (strain ATCC MYA-139 / BCRC 22969 / CBS 8797 / KCTC 17520 / NBRC 10181 / NCYC 3082 / Yp74L-3) TaxID=1071383 RepID=J7S461_HUIN7|nr:hypothetical protein KNAG_0A07530 [Kazachstania naganishii CBS 8797]CCK68406.1 hypothetical protein KNAG_0A07530 [Kazachstania naganishii CBS 8797]